MQNPVRCTKRPVNRRAFVKSGLLAGGPATVVVSLSANGISVIAQERAEDGRLDAEDVAILRFLATAEIIESGSYQAALQNLGGDANQYITSNAVDKISHATFLNGYLRPKGADPANFDEFLALQENRASRFQTTSFSMYDFELKRRRKRFVGLQT